MILKNIFESNYNNCEGNKKVYVTACCHSFALASWRYCPRCGRLAEQENDVETNDELDFDQTL